MNKKRIAAFMAAATMLLNVTPVMAAEVQTVTAGAANVSGSGTVSAYDKTPIFKVTLPTANALDFTVDPYGLLDIASGSSVNIDELANSGAIKSASGSAAVIKNQSSVPVTVNLKMTAKSEGKTINFKTVGSEVATGDAVNMFLAIIPSSKKAVSAADYTAAGYAIPVTTTASNAKFKLDKAKYEVVNTNGSFAMKLVSDAANYDSTVFKVGGLANPEADWSDFMAGKDSSVGLDVVFSYVQSEDADVVDTSAGVYGLVSGTATLTDDMGASAAISGAGLKASSEAGIDYEVTAFSISKDYTITINDGRTIDAIKIADTATTFSGNLTTGKIDNDKHTIVVPAGTYGKGALTAGVKYLKLKSADGDITIKLNCVE